MSEPELSFDPEQTKELEEASPTLGRVVQRPVYFISEVLRDTKSQYPKIQKLLYAILVASRKLQHYFQAHKVSVVTSFTLDCIFHNRETTGRIVEWAIKLGEFDLHFINCHAIKSCALANFVVEWARVPKDKEEELFAAPRHENPEHWTMHFDGSFTLLGTGARVVLTSPTSEQL